MLYSNGRQLAIDAHPLFSLLAQMLASVDFPIQIPVFDISHIIKPMSQKMKDKEEYSA